MPMNNITRIEDLPELSDIDNSYGGGVMGSMGSGMGSGMGNTDPKMNKYIRNYTRQTYNNTMDNMNSRNSEPYQSQMYIEQEPKVYEKEFYEPTPLPTRLNCLDVCNHIKDCPLCSKFYHNDNTLFIIIIVCLLILTVILTRKVLNL